MNKLIERNLIESGYKASVIISGGGSSFISNILKFPGASEFVVDAQIPYSKEALFECLKNKYPSFCNSYVATEMARIAYDRSVSLIKSKKKSLGIACTSALKTNRKRQGSDRAYASILFEKTQYNRFFSIPLISRENQESYLAQELLNYINDCLENYNASIN